MKKLKIIKPKVNKFPLYSSPIRAGFPSPAESITDRSLDLNDYLVSHPSSTYLLRVKGDSMEGAGIFDGDVLIVDRSLDAVSGSLIIAMLDGEFTVKRLVKTKNKIILHPENPKYKDIEVNTPNELEIWGVVVHCIHSYLK